MAVKLPPREEEAPKKKTTKKLAKKTSRKLKVTSPEVQNDALSPEDQIDYGLTVEVSLDKGRKAWVRFAGSTSVRDGETTEHARKRLTDYVNAEIDRRLDELS